MKKRREEMQKPGEQELTGFGEQNSSSAPKVKVINDYDMEN
jgi:hypothetical protein